MEKAENILLEFYACISIVANAVAIDYLINERLREKKVDRSGDRDIN